MPFTRKSWKVVVFKAHGIFRLSERVLHLRATIPTDGRTAAEVFKIVYNLVTQMERERDAGVHGSENLTKRENAS